MRELTPQEHRLSLELVKFPMTYAAPIYFGNPSGEGVKVNNGTVTLVKYREIQYGITNHHVIDEYRNRKCREDIGLFIGNCRVELDSILVDEDATLDLCTLNLGRLDIESAGTNGEVPTRFFELEEFVVHNLKKGDFVLLGGFPGAWRAQPKSNELIFDTLSSGGTEVSDVTEENICCSIAIEKCEVILRVREELPSNFGGISGGPVFAHQFTEFGLSIFKLIGVIYQYSEMLDVLMIRPISLINKDLTINKN